MVFEAIRLQLCTMTHSRKNEYQDRYSFKKRSSQYERRQQECTIAKRGNVDEKNNSQNYHTRKKNNGGRK